MTGTASVDAGRCVHARIATATCQACVAACPRRALSLDDDGLNLSEPDCDGCGLCMAACPTRAIDAPAGSPTRRSLAGRTVLMAACERAVPEDVDGRLVCLHALSVTDLLRHWRNGERVWLISTADCIGCERGSGDGFATRVDNVNALLRARGEPPIQVKPLPPARWHRLREGSDVPFRDRRGFLGRLLWRPASALLEGHTGEDLAPDCPAPGECLTGQGPLPWAIRLDPLACVACDACVRVCPGKALSLDGVMPGIPDREGPSLRLAHTRCTGCGLCVDVCEPRAIEVRAWSLPVADRVALRESVCRVCGAPFRMPAMRTETPGICWVCMRNRPARRLYQVLVDDEDTTGVASAEGAAEPG